LAKEKVLVVAAGTATVETVGTSTVENVVVDTSAAETAGTSETTAGTFETTVGTTTAFGYRTTLNLESYYP